jgi:hypothetical protein
MIPVASDRDPVWPSHPHATRDSLHEHDMWVAEGLTHRYPTKVLAELLSTCPQYCGHCTRMDLVGNSTPTVDKLKLSLKRFDRYSLHLDYLKAHPGRTATWSSPRRWWPNVHVAAARGVPDGAFVGATGARPFRLATKAEGLPLALAAGRRVGGHAIASRSTAAPRGPTWRGQPRQPRGTR